MVKLVFQNDGEITYMCRQGLQHLPLHGPEFVLR